MASGTPLAHLETNPQTPVDRPPAYNTATESRNYGHDAVSTESYVGSLFSILFLCDRKKLTLRPDDGRVDIRINESDAQLAQQLQQVHLEAEGERSETPE